MRRQPAPCIIEGCARLGNVPGSGLGMCRPHYQRQREATASPCAADRCSRPSRAKGLCTKHLSRLGRFGGLDLPTVADQFWLLVAQGTTPSHAPELGPCWLWTGRLSTRGYSRLDPHRGMHLLGHRWAYEALVAPIPDGLTIDHLCRVKACVNPYHMDPVPNVVNVLRGHEARREAA